VEDRLLWTAEQRLVATSLETHRAIAWPDDIRDALMRQKALRPEGR